MISNIRSLTPAEAKIVLSMTEEGRTTTDRQDIGRRLGSDASIGKLIASLRRKGWLARVGRSRYVLVPAAYGPEAFGETNTLALAAASVTPSYIGWWNAAAHHGFTTQFPVAVTVGSTSHHPPRRIDDLEVRYVHLSERKFFGFRDEEVYGRKVPISDPEKTVLDCVERPKLCGGPSESCRILWGASRTLDWPKLLSYVRRNGSISLAQRLGFLCSLAIEEAPDDFLAGLKSLIGPNSRSAFGPREARPDAIGFVRAWNLFVGYSERDLLAEVPRPSQRPTSS